MSPASSFSALAPERAEASHSPLRLAPRHLGARHAAILIPEPGARHFLAAPRGWRLTAAGRLIAEGAARRALLILDGLLPGAEHLLELEGAEPLAFRAADCAGLADVSRFGAREGSEDNGAAIAAAMAAAGEGGTVLIPAGRWITGPVFLRSGLTLRLEEGATLALTPDRSRIPILPARDGAGRMLASWEGLPEASYASLITGIGLQKIAVTGLGALEGGGSAGDWWSWPKETREGARRARTIFLSRCEDVTLSGVTVRDSPSWTVHPLLCRRVSAFGLRIENPPDSPNTDGFDPEMCAEVLLEGLHVSVGDDCVAVKAGKRGPQGESDHLAPCSGLRIRHCLLERGHGGVVMGSEMSGGVRDVGIEDCDFLGTDRGLRIKTRRGRGGSVSDLRLSRSVMRRVETGISVNSFYFCDPDGTSDVVQSREPRPVDDLTPAVSGLRIEELRMEEVRVAAGAFFGLPESPLRGVEIRRLSVSYDASPTGDVPDMALNLPLLHHAGLVAQFADLTLEETEVPLSILGEPSC
ncbi:polygalacturonase PglA [Neomegalonema perideroedes]|uniref:polygalacturonase PglA n=1 Tax=Neomegalonema perideroedes TaxID=217219 RepID=UPI00037CA3A9|nr:glycoside hydrolase family 28 protein [Neomegalonema perideroedes]